MVRERPQRVGYIYDSEVYIFLARAHKAWMGRDYGSSSKLGLGKSTIFSGLRRCPSRPIWSIQLMRKAVDRSRRGPVYREIRQVAARERRGKDVDC